LLDVGCGAFLPLGDETVGNWDAVVTEFLDDTNSGLGEAPEMLICEVLSGFEQVCVPGDGLQCRGSVESPEALLLLPLEHLLSALG
jgi:hypothetical protein